MHARRDLQVRGRVGVERVAQERETRRRLSLNPEYTFDQQRARALFATTTNTPYHFSTSEWLSEVFAACVRTFFPHHRCVPSHRRRHAASTFFPTEAAY